LRLQISHRTHYVYSQPVFLEPQVLRLKPPTNAAQRLLSYDLTIEPPPAGQSYNTDLESNETVVIWFGGLTDHLTLTSVSTVDTLRDNPFDYLWDGPDQLPVAYPESQLALLAPYRDQGFIDVSVRQLAAELSMEAAADAQKFLPLLNLRLHDTLHRVERETGAARAPEDTLRRVEGSCRDFAVLFLAVARANGFAGRFVSGYFAPAGRMGPYELHAWAEVYIPGGGWRGFDPTYGIATADRHIAVAYAAQAELAAPVRGSLRGLGTTEMTAEVVITEL
jgi:transglutaminase-like putative cysteine protease